MDWTEVLALGGVSAPSRPGVPDIACWARCPDQGHPRSRSARTPPWSPTPRLSPTDPGDPCPGLTSSSTSTLDWSLCTSSLTSLSAPGEGSCGVREACSPPCAPHPGPASRPHAGGLPVWGLALGTKFSPSSCRVSPALAPPSSRASPAPAPARVRPPVLPGHPWMPRPPLAGQAAPLSALLSPPASPATRPPAPPSRHFTADSSPQRLRPALPPATGSGAQLPAAGASSGSRD